MSRLKYLFVIAACAMVPALEAMPIFSQGKEQAIIVVADDASPVTLYAARELAWHLDQATKGHFALKKEKELLPGDSPYRIYVGLSEGVRRKKIDMDVLNKNQYVIFPAKEALYLVGKDEKEGEVPETDSIGMGSLLAVYEWMDREIGVRWIWPGETGTVVPRHAEISTKEGAPTYGKPTYFHSDLRFYSGFFKPGQPSRYGRGSGLDDRSFFLGSQWLRRQKVVRTMGNASFYGHGFGSFWERFGKEHPEYFAMRPDGKRGPVDERTRLTQLCVSNPDLHKLIIKEWLKTRTPERPWINGCENDRRAIDPFCFCPNCKAWDVPEAKVSVPRNPWHIESREETNIDPYERVSMSDRYARFLLELLKEGKKHDPKAKVIGYAYSFYSDAPVKTKLNSDVVIIVVPPYVYPLDKGKENLGRQLWDSWKATGAQLVYRPNDFLVGYAMPYVYPKQFGRDFKYYHDHGTIATDFDSLTAMWGTQGVNAYMLGRLHARPDLTPDDVLEEYYAAFGPARETIREYIEYWEKITTKCDSAFQEEVNGGWAVMMKAGFRIFTPETYAEGKRILEKAVAETRSEPVESKRVEYLAVWLEHARLTTEALSVFRSFRPDNVTPEDRRKFNVVFQKLKRFRADHEETLVGANWALMARWEPWRLWKE